MDSPTLGPGGGNKISRMEISFGWCAAALVFKIFLVGVSIRVVRDGIGVQRIAAARLARTPPVRLANYPTNPLHLSFASVRQWSSSSGARPWRDLGLGALASDEGEGEAH